jgi:hypothetical protein
MGTKDLPDVAPRDDIYRVWRHECTQATADEVALPEGEACAQCGARPTAIDGRFAAAHYLDGRDLKQ